jgi:hypothetical protein
MNDAQPESPFHLAHGLSDRIRQIAVKIEGDQLGQDFRIRFGTKGNPFFFQLFFQQMVVFNNAVVNDENIFRLVPLRMGVLHRRLTVGCPPGMGDTAGPVHGFAVYQRFQARNFSQFSKAGNFVSVLDRQTRRVVSPIFKPFQPFDQNRLCIFLSHITNDPTHIKTLLPHPILN